MCRQIRIHPVGYPVQERYFSPVSRPDQPDILQIIIRFETAGILSQHFKQLSVGMEQGTGLELVG